LERSVGVEGSFECRGQWLMQEQQVEPVDPELSCALIECVPRGIVPIVADPHLRLEKYLIADDAGTTKALADLALVGVCGCGINQPVTDRHGRIDGGRCLGRRALEHAEPEGGQLDTVVQRHMRIANGLGHGFSSPCVFWFPPSTAWARLSPSIRL